MSLDGKVLRRTVAMYVTHVLQRGHAILHQPRYSFGAVIAINQRYIIIRTPDTANAAAANLLAPAVPFQLF